MKCDMHCTDSKGEQFGNFCPDCEPEREDGEQGNDRLSGLLGGGLSFDKWCDEIVRMVKERVPDFADEQARLLAESMKDAYDEGDTPEQALNAEMECWTDDGEE